MTFLFFFGDDSPRRATRGDHLVGLVLCLAYTAWLLATARTLGFPRDEGFYFRAAHDYSAWFRVLFEQPARAFEQPIIDSAWGYNHEHPALAKSLFALSWMFLWQKWHLFTDASTAMRLPAMLMGGGTLWVTYLFGVRVYSRRAGLIAALLLAAMPHVFFHAHLACFDVPILFMWTLCIYVYWRSMITPHWGWILAAGVVYGLTLETKHNAWVLPAVFFPHAFLLLATGAKGSRRARWAVPGTLLSMLVLGPLVFVACWPWLWNDTIERIGNYGGFHLNHEYYNIEFLHRNYFGPPSPWAYAPVMIAATVPTVTLLLMVVGLGERVAIGWRRLRHAVALLLGRAAVEPLVASRAEADVLFALAAGAAIAPFFLPRTPIFGGTKHWMTAYPFLALFAGRGFDLALNAMMRALEKAPAALRDAAPWALAGTVLVAPFAITAHSHPFGISAYVPFVGGTQGGASLGLFRQFWGYTTQDAAPYMEANAPPNARVYIHDTAWDSWSQMLTEGRVRRDLHAVGAPGDADVALVQYELHMLEVDYQMWSVFGPAPAAVVTHDGVPFVGIYQRGKP
jgi:4-amino-4-deoxy-L-arabinose transferase-like glycosyltransferase